MKDVEKLRLIESFFPQQGSISCVFKDVEHWWLLSVPDSQVHLCGKQVK